MRCTIPAGVCLHRFFIITIWKITANSHFHKVPAQDFQLPRPASGSLEIHCLRHIKEEAKWKKIEGPTYHGIFWIIL